MNEAQKMAAAIRLMMSMEKDGLVDALMCMAAAASDPFLADISERFKRPDLAPGDTIVTVEAPMPSGAIWTSHWTKDEIEAVNAEYDRGNNIIRAIKKIRELKGSALAESKFTAEEMVRRGLLK